MPITIRKQLVIKVQDAEFIFEPIVLADVMDFAEETSQREMLGLLSKKIKGWKGIEDEEGNEIECSGENFLNILPLDIAGEVMRQLLEVAGIGEQFAKKLETRSQ